MEEKTKSIPNFLNKSLDLTPITIPEKSLENSYHSIHGSNRSSNLHKNAQLSRNKTIHQPRQFNHSSKMDKDKLNVLIHYFNQKEASNWKRNTSPYKKHKEIHNKSYITALDMCENFEENQQEDDEDDLINYITTPTKLTSKSKASQNKNPTTQIHQSTQILSSPVKAKTNISIQKLLSDKSNLAIHKGILMKNSRYQKLIRKNKLSFILKEKPFKPSSSSPYCNTEESEQMLPRIRGQLYNPRYLNKTFDLYKIKNSNSLLRRSSPTQDQVRSSSNSLDLAQQIREVKLPLNTQKSRHSKISSFLHISQDNINHFGSQSQIKNKSSKNYKNHRQFSNDKKNEINNISSSMFPHIRSHVKYQSLMNCYSKTKLKHKNLSFFK